MEGMQANPAQIKKYLKQLNSSREQYINYLGQLAYQEYKDGNLPNPVMQDACSTLDEIAGQVAKWEQDLVTIEQMKQAAKNPRCAYCGTALAKNAPFCSTCGRPATAAAGIPMPPQYATAPAAPASGKTCLSCGGPLESDAVFCTSCGQPVTAPAEAVPAEAAPEPAPAEAAPAETAPETTAEATPELAVPAPPAPPAPPTPEAPTPEESAPTPPAPEESTPEESAPGTPVCPSCGQAVGDPEALFCTSCGAKML